MANAKRVLMVGLDPAVVDYSKWPGLTAAKLEAALRGDQATLNGEGYDTSICFVDRGATADAVLRNALAGAAFDCVMVGAGVRLDPEHFLLFETLINVIHQHAPGAKICFNTGPTDSAAAVRRWL